MRLEYTEMDLLFAAKENDDNKNNDDNDDKGAVE
jgi:hypothetical protein